MTAAERNGASESSHALPDHALPDVDRAPGGDVRAVVELASLAPSVHNTQPWRFEWDGASLSVREDRSRALPVLDPSGRERVLSCGAAVLHARLAFAELGHATRTTVLPDPADDELLARITVTGHAPSDEQTSALVAAMPRRTTDRDPFDDRPVPQPAREALRAAAEAEGAWLRFVGEQDADDAVELQVLLAHADAGQRSDPAYLAELASWRSDRTAEGVPARALPSVPVDQRGSSWALRDFDQPHRSGAPASPADPPAAEHPSVVVLGTSADSREDWVVAGQALARVLLRATVEGLSSQPLTQVLEVPVLRGGMRRALGVVGHPQMLLRVGYGSAGPTTRRRPVQDVLSVVPPA